MVFVDFWSDLGLMFEVFLLGMENSKCWKVGFQKEKPPSTPYSRHGLSEEDFDLSLLVFNGPTQRDAKDVHATMQLICSGPHSAYKMEVKELKQISGS